ncbi:MAG: Mov34/MPN/PAD-1 family protein [Desulfarculus sp.]|nr:Mov34/MPN/PAD-1 family protein [Desulfarculus sp.]MBV1738034.1 Mov34/MPN/PAD-1 family protein [Desulfarculus sp.]MBV1752090.1 Mov34/MPN/PAD-1 family protein [Desulfarculus sp.]
MKEDGAHWFPKETGGILVGYWSADKKEVVVTNIISAGPNAHHGRVIFKPDHEYQQQELDRILNFGAEPLFYLGDWHTHPNGKLKLSILDMITLWRIARNPEAYAPTPVMLVLARGNPWVFGGWYRNAAGHRLLDPFSSVSSIKVRRFD